MSWLRIDDGFFDHPKVLRLAARDRWTWLGVLCYCARFRTDGVVDATISDAVRGASPAFLHRCHELHLLDLNEWGNYVVHNWTEYNPKDTGAERSQRYRDRKRDAAGSSPHVEVTSRVTSPSRDDAVTPRDESRNTRAGARARPVPSPKNLPSVSQSVASDAARAREQRTDGLTAGNQFDDLRPDFGAALSDLRPGGRTDV